MSDSSVSDYVQLIRRFTSKELDVVDFERIYLQMFKSQKANLPGPAYRILDVLFSDVDSFCSDPNLCSDDDLNEEQLRERCGKCLDELIECS